MSHCHTKELWARLATVERIVEYVAPFGTADRERDYAVAWAEFERRAAGAAGRVRV